MRARDRALITGASSGIGSAYARELAINGWDLIITARREEKLRRLAEQLTSAHEISVEVIPADLTILTEVNRLEDKIRSDDLVMLVNNAGFGVSGPYHEQTIDRHQRMIDVHVTATVRLTHAALPVMLLRKRGYIINVSSVAGFLPAGAGPGYCASKAYLNVFSTNLQSLLSGRGIKVQALCPGYTYTEFHSSSDYHGNEREVLPRWLWMTAEDVVRYSLRKLADRKVIAVPGLKNRMIVFFLKSRLAGAVMSWRNRHSR